MTQTNCYIHPSMVKRLEVMPKEVPAVLLLRHSVRNALPPGEAGNAEPITDEGKVLAVRLGETLRPRLRRLHTSPVLRCVQTAECMKEGAATNHSIVLDRLLGDPGAYVVDGHVAWSNWKRLGHGGVMRHLVNSSEALPGMARPDEAARRLANHTLDIAGDEPGLHVFVTHDFLVLATVARLWGKAMGTAEWPWFLEGAFLWRTAEGICIAYRGEEGICVTA